MTKRDDIARLQKVAKALKKIDDEKHFNKLAFYTPYEKQQQFHDYGLTKRERLLMAGNQVGKTFCGGAEVAMHLTGRYPDWWLGRRFERPTRFWVAGVTGESTRDNPQRILCGTKATGYGAGALPRDAVKWEKDTTLARGVSDLFDTIIVQHVSGGRSELKFKSYERGREKWQGDTLDGVWFDEEPPMDIYSEGLTRISATKGLVFVTFTPLQGMSDVVIRYLQQNSPDRAVVTMGIEDAKHIPAEERASIIAGYPAHEREARANGTPLLGEGRVWVTSERRGAEVITVSIPEPTISEVPIPKDSWPGHWLYMWSIDFGGMGHPFAAVLNGWDKDTDTIHVLRCIRMEGRPIDHVQAMKAISLDPPVIWPHDGTARESAGESLAAIYKKHGLKMAPEHATFESGGYSTEAGVTMMIERMTTNRYKVGADLADWWEEYRMYHRKKGLIVKERDDLMSASRIGVMARRMAKMIPEWRPGYFLGSKPAVKIASGVDFPLT